MRTAAILIAGFLFGYLLATAAGAQADGGPDCYRNHKEIPPQACALLTMNAYAELHYFAPRLLTFAGKGGRYRSKWRGYYIPPNGTGGALNPSRFRLTSRRCNGHVVVTDHRTGKVWPHAC